MEWPEKCFRSNAGALQYLKGLVPKNSRIVRAKSEDDFLRYLPRATHAIVWDFKKEWFALAPRLKVLATPGAGRELVAWQDAPKNVAVHFGGFHGAIISETVVGFMLAWAHGFFRPELKKAGWQRTALSDKCRTVASTRAVIIGYGKIGKAIGDKLEALGVDVIGLGRRTVYWNEGLAVDFSKLRNLEISQLREKAIRGCDWLILALPSDTGTDNFLNAALIKKLLRSCVVINVGRGNSVDEAALIAALKSGRLSGAYLDVFKGEPGPLANIKNLGTGPGILGTGPERLPWNLIKTPHSSAFSDDYIKRAFQELKDDGML